jgi:uncharacterized membrane protein
MDFSKFLEAVGETDTNINIAVGVVLGAIHIALIVFMIWYLPNHEDKKDNDLARLDGWLGVLLAVTIIPYFAVVLAYRRRKQEKNRPVRKYI